MSDRPNILWICSDQQRHDTLGCYGNRWVNTPRLDALASQGLIFRDAFAQSPACTPSRASFLTGRYPRTCRTRQNGADIPDDEVLVTQLLADAGYHCGLAGKLHLRACHPSVCPQHESRIDDGYTEFYWSHHPEDDWPLPAHDYAEWIHAQGGAIGWKPHPDCRYLHVGAIRGSASRDSAAQLRRGRAGSQTVLPADRSRRWGLWRRRWIRLGSDEHPRSPRAPSRILGYVRSDPQTGRPDP